MLRSALSIAAGVLTAGVDHAVGLFAVFGASMPMFWSAGQLHGYVLSIGVASGLGAYIAARIVASRDRRPRVLAAHALPVSLLAVTVVQDWRAIGEPAWRLTELGGAAALGLAGGVWLATRRGRPATHVAI